MVEVLAVGADDGTSAAGGARFSAVSTNYGGCPKDVESWLDASEIHA